MLWYCLNSSTIGCAPLGRVMCLSSNTLCSIQICKYFRDSVGDNVSMFLALSIHYDFGGVGRRRNLSSMLCLPCELLCPSMYSKYVLYYYVIYSSESTLNVPLIMRLCI